MSVVVAVFAVGAMLPLYLESFKPARRQVDPVADRRRGSILPTEKMPTFGAEKAKRGFLGLVRRKKGRGGDGSGDATRNGSVVGVGVQHVEDSAIGAARTAGRGQEREGEQIRQEGRKKEIAVQ